LTAGAAGNRDAALAVSRCYGAIFFAVFGGAWLLLAAYAFGRLSIFEGVLIAAVVVLFVIAAMRLQRRGKDVGKDAVPAEEQHRNDRIFGIVNAVTWITVFLVFMIFPLIGHDDLAIPAVALIVGLHFFPMPPLYRHTANLVTGACIAVWAIVCPMLFQGDRMIGFVAAGAGLALWASAAWALKTAVQILRSAGL
jgi:Ca2+/Na+ antiporter